MTKARSNAVANAAKGDLTVGSGTNTSAILSLGANGDSLVADNATSTGLRYQVPVNVNPLLNSSFQIFQRGTTGTITSGIGFPSADRWNAWTLAAGGSVTLSQQLTNDTTNLPFIQYCGRFQRVAANTNTGLLALGQAMETVNSRPYAGKTVTVSYYARKGANYSQASSTVTVQLWSATTTDASLNAVQVVSTTVLDSTPTLTTTWQRFTATGTIGATATQLAIAAIYAPTGTAGANDYFEITGVQIEVGSVATPFKTYAGTIQGELAACQRYLPAIIANNNNIFGFALNTVVSFINCQLPVTARVAPTGITIPALSNFTLFNSAASSGTPTAIAFDNAGTSAAFLTVTTSAGAPALIAKDPIFLRVSNANGYILFTGCEL